MIPGSGPGRGVPWWRGREVVIHPVTGVFGREPAGFDREGRLLPRRVDSSKS